eukprot:5120367-Amphidinium_carterae.1
MAPSAHSSVSLLAALLIQVGYEVRWGNVMQTLASEITEQPTMLAALRTHLLSLFPANCKL